MSVVVAPVIVESVDAPEILRDAPSRNPLAVRFVPDALVNPSVWNMPYPLAVILVDETAARIVWPEISNKVPCKNPEAVRFVEETEARVLCPEAFNVTVWRYPLAVTLVEDTLARAAFVEFNVGKVP